MLLLHSQSPSQDHMLPTAGVNHQRRRRTLADDTFPVGSPHRIAWHAAQGRVGQFIPQVNVTHEIDLVSVARAAIWHPFELELLNDGVLLLVHQMPVT